MQDLNEKAKSLSEIDLENIYTAPGEFEGYDNVFWGGECWGQVCEQSATEFDALNPDGQYIVDDNSWPTFEIAAQVACGKPTDVPVIRVNN